MEQGYLKALARYLAGGSALISGLWLGVLSASIAEDADWFDAELQLQRRIAAVNEGDLRFLPQLPVGTGHHHQGRIVISGQSLQDGWVLLEQCHANLDRVAAAQIVFNPDRSRALEVVSFQNMDAALAEGSSVQLRGIRGNSQVCLRLYSRALHPLDGGGYELRNGPYMRRFLDGYYPLRVSLRIDHPANLVLVATTPAAQPGFAVNATPGQVQLEAVFEGELRTRMRFITNGAGK